MRTLAFATLAFSLISGSAAFADSIQTGDASQAPVFATAPGDTSDVADVGSANRPPVFDHAYGSGTLVTQVGNANRAPEFDAGADAN
jgi:hypothetical protein